MSETSEIPATPAPISKEELEEMDKLMVSYQAAQEELTQLELAKPRLLVALSRLLDARAVLENRWLVDRGLPPGTPFEVDPDTGTFKVIQS